MQTKLFGCALLLAACTTSPSTDDKALPSATNTPHLKSLATNVVCGEDIAFYGAATPDLRYAFNYDNQERLHHANGVWVESGTVDTTDYTWAGWNVTNILSVSGWDGSEEEISASYGADDSLLSYTYAYSSEDYSDSWTYGFSNFVGAHQPTREIITNGTHSFVYELVYDAYDRLIAAIPESGATTTWTYDEVARQITQDTGNGAYVGVLSFDAQYRATSEVFTGSDPSVIDYEETYAWNGDDLDTITYKMGSEAAPHTLDLIQVSTMRYDCAAARTQERKPTRFARITQH